MIEFFVAATMRLPFLWKSTKEVCSMQGLWYSSNTTSVIKCWILVTGFPHNFQGHFLAWGVWNKIPWFSPMRGNPVVMVPRALAHRAAQCIPGWCIEPSDKKKGRNRCQAVVICYTKDYKLWNFVGQEIYRCYVTRNTGNNYVTKIQVCM
jgi:hypothetical protein